MNDRSPYSVIMAEDELPARTLLTGFVKTRPELILQAVAKNGEEAVQSLSSAIYDLLLLDINLPVFSGIEVLEKITQIPYVIFTTAYSHYAVKAFEIGAIDYLHKPFSLERFNRAIDRFLSIKQDHVPVDVYRSLQVLKGDDKYQKSSLTAEAAEKYAQDLLNYMLQHKAYRECEITLQKIAEVLAIPPHHLSQVINQHFKKNFYHFINHYRVEEAKLILQDPTQQHKNIIEIAFEVGFNSKSAFNAIFKKLCYQTPTEFRKKPHYNGFLGDLYPIPDRDGRK